VDKIAESVSPKYRPSEEKSNEESRGDDLYRAIEKLREGAFRGGKRKEHLTS